MDEKDIEAMVKNEATTDSVDADNIPSEENDDDMSKLKDVVTETAAQAARLFVAWIWTRLGRKKE